MCVKIFKRVEESSHMCLAMGWQWVRPRVLAYLAPHPNNITLQNLPLTQPPGFKSHTPHSTRREILKSIPTRFLPTFLPNKVKKLLKIIRTSHNNTKY